MNSSLLPNDIEDLDGLELKDQVTKIKEYIEYMREQLQWYAGVTGKAESEYVQGVTTYYGKSTSPNIPPSQWSTEAPSISDGEYLWQYTKVTRSGVTTRSDPVCVSAASDGEDAALVYIHSSNGTIFRADNTGTVLTVTVYYGSDAIRTLTNLQTAFGSDAHLAWYERAYGSSTDVLISPSDSRISNYGFTLTLTSADIANRATYSCHLMLSATEERAQSSITITDIEDGQTLYATSQTAATTAAKTATIQSGTFTLESGAMVAVMFANKNTAANPTLNVDNTGAIPIRAGNASLAANSKYNWTDNSTVIFIYDGTYWQMDGVPALDKADDAAKVATNYITDVPNDDGITVSGNNATAEVVITDTVRVQADSTHYTEMTDSGFDIHSGSASEVAGRFGTRTSPDGNKFNFLSFPDPTNSFSLALIEGVVRTDDIQYGALQLSDENNHKLIEACKGLTYGGGYLRVFYGDASDTVGAQLGKMSYTNAWGTLINQEPTLFFKDPNDNYRSFYSLHRAYIDDGNNHAGFVVYGNSPNHGITVDYITSGRINFYVDGTSIGYAPITSSDERVKTNIEPIDDRFKRAVQKVELKNFNFDFNDSVREGANLQKRFGAIAQDVIRALDDEGINYESSELVETMSDDSGEYFTINYVPFLIARLAADEDRIKALEDKLKEGS